MAEFLQRLTPTGSMETVRLVKITSIMPKSRTDDLARAIRLIEALVPRCFCKRIAPYVVVDEDGKAEYLCERHKNEGKYGPNAKLEAIIAAIDFLEKMRPPKAVPDHAAPYRAAEMARLRRLEE
jgi:hypothetical protein